MLCENLHDIQIQQHYGGVSLDFINKANILSLQSRAVEMKT